MLRIEERLKLPPDYFNMADYFVFSNVEAGRGDKTALIFEDKRISYREVAGNVARVSNGLLDMGLQAEQRVLTILHDRPEFAYFWFGAIKAGGVATQINPLLPTEDFAYYLNYTKAFAAAVEAEALPKLRPALKEARYLRHLIVVGDADLNSIEGDFDVHAFKQVLQDYDDVPATMWLTTKDDPAVWLFTSGTTGQSKGAVHNHSHFPFNTEVYARNFIGVRGDDITISGPRLFFGYATGTNLMFPFVVGATTVLFKEHPTPERLAELIEKHKATVLTSVPTLINKFLQSPEIRRESLASLRFKWSAGEALPPDLHARWEEAFGVPIIDGIGSAESFHIYISNRPAGPLGKADIKPGSLGKVVPGYTAKLLDDEGNAVKPDEIGTLWLGGDSVATHYHGAYEKSKEHLRGGWVVSGDKFRQDEQGYWFYEGRGDDLLKVGGIFVSPLDLENCLMQHAAVKECCVIGKQDEAGLTKPLALVVLKPGSKGPAVDLEQELIDHCKSKLVRYKAPRWVKFIDNPLPRNDRDKIDRKQLRKEFG